MESVRGINHCTVLSISTGHAVVALDLEPPTAGAGASGGAGAAAGSSDETFPPSHSQFAANDSLRFQKAILSDNIDHLEKFIGNPHIISKEGFDGLMIAAQKGLYKSLKWCIENGIGRAGVDKKERKCENTALMMACQPGAAGSDKRQRASCVRLLLLAGANPGLQNQYGDTALHMAIISKSKAIVEIFCALPPDLKSYLFSIRNNKGLSPLDLANTFVTTPESTPESEINTLLINHSKGLSPAVKMTLEPEALRPFIDKTIPMCVFGSTIKDPDPKLKLKKKATGEDVEVPIGDYLASQARSGSIDTLKKFEARLACVDSDGRNVFMSACVARKTEVLKWLLENFEAATGKPPIDALNERDDYGCTPTHFAAAGGTLVTQGEATCMELLIEAGGKALNINMKDTAGFAPIHIASQNLYPKIVKALMKRTDCDLNIFVDGLSPLQLAEFTRNSRLAAASPEDAQEINQLFTEVRDALLRDVAPPSSSSAPVENPLIAQLELSTALLMSLGHPDGLDPLILTHLREEVDRLLALRDAAQPVPEDTAS